MGNLCSSAAATAATTPGAPSKIPPRVTPTPTQPSSASGASVAPSSAENAAGARAGAGAAPELPAVPVVSEEYRWDHSTLRISDGPYLGLSETVPSEQSPKIAWLMQVAMTGINVAFNHLAAQPRASIAEYVAGLVTMMQASHLVDHSADARNDIMSKLATLLSKVADVRAGEVGARTYDHYKGLFQHLPVPWVAPYWRDDRMFGWMRVAGFNPLVIERVTPAKLRDLVTRMALTDAMIAAVNGNGDTFAAAASEKRLYVADYSLLSSLENGTLREGGGIKFIFKPVCILTVAAGRRSLMPVAIQCISGRDTLTKADGELWQQAKLVVQNADGNYHELISHLARTHLIMEPMVVSAYRHLPRDHPLFKLLEAHGEGTIFLNNKAAHNLIAAGGQIDQILSPTIATAQALAIRSRQSPGFNDLMLPAQLLARGMGDADLPIDYPYKEDAQDLWETISSWAATFVEAVYGGEDANVADDAALRDWALDVFSPYGGNLPNFGEPGPGGAPPHGTITTCAYLTRALTMIIFTASAQHAAVNFSQLDLLSFAPFVPGMLLRDAPTRGGDATEAATLAFLPQLDDALTQVDLATILGSVHYTRLGQYEPGTFSHLHNDELTANLVGGIHAFQAGLERVQRRISVRNATRMHKYTYMLPDGIPQSINI